jgi:Contractile injection system tube protein
MADPVEVAFSLAQSAGFIAAHLVGPVRAQLYCVDDPDLSVDLSFNPQSLTLDRSSQITNNPGKVYKPFETGSAGSNDTLTFQTWLDASQPPAAIMALASLNPYTVNIAGQKASILDDMKALHALTIPREVTDSEPAGLIRPPVVLFLWESFKFTGLITSMSFQVKLFDALGAPRRASVDITLEGRAFYATNDPTTFLDAGEAAESFAGAGIFAGDTKYGLTTATRATALRLALRLL